MSAMSLGGNIGENGIATNATLARMNETLLKRINDAWWVMSDGKPSRLATDREIARWQVVRVIAYIHDV